MRLWFLSNGRGEDRAAALIAAELRTRRSAVDLAGAPLLTEGAAFAARGISTPVTGVSPPSGGFPAAGLATAIRDVPAVPSYLAYVRRLRQLGDADDLFIAVGDLFLTGLARLAFRRSGVHVALAKSVHGRRHSRLERYLLKRWTRLVFARDDATAVDLARGGVRCEFVGNPLVDDVSGARFGVGSIGLRTSGDRPSVLLLPGSRAEASANLVKLLEIADCVAEPATWECAWPDNVAMESGAEAVARAGWVVVQQPATPGSARTLNLVAGQFMSLVSRADVVLGLAGSANEQAAALGKPIVTLVGCGPQTTAARMEEQERLLGGAAEFVRAGAPAAAAAVSMLLREPAERARRGALGAKRLGPCGGAARIADRLVEEFHL